MIKSGCLFLLLTVMVMSRSNELAVQLNQLVLEKRPFKFDPTQYNNAVENLKKIGIAGDPLQRFLKSNKEYDSLVFVRDFWCIFAQASKSGSEYILEVEGYRMRSEEASQRFLKDFCDTYHGDLSGDAVRKYRIYLNGIKEKHFDFTEQHNL